MMRMHRGMVQSTIQHFSTLRGQPRDLLSYETDTHPKTTKDRPTARLRARLVPVPRCHGHRGIDGSCSSSIYLAIEAE